MTARMTKIARWFDLLERAQWLAVLLVRASVGYMFAASGWGKLHKIGELVHYFESLGIPAASVQAPFVATLELVGGVALFLGLGTRVFGALLAGTMAVALVTAFLPDPKNRDPANLFYLAEWLLIVILVWLTFAGPGKVSLDRLLRRRLAPDKEPAR
jgi:putative oxidoreductase